MISIDQLTAEWGVLSETQQLAQWASFLDDLDAGSGGLHRYYPVLMPRWDRGDVPDAINERQLARHEDELRAEALAEPWGNDGWIDFCIRQLDPAMADIGLAELPF